jgi:hypothetical protein
VFARQAELCPLDLGLCVVDQNVGHADAFDRNEETAIVEELDDRRTEAAGQRMLFERDEARVRLGQF